MGDGVGGHAFPLCPLQNHISVALLAPASPICWLPHTNPSMPQPSSPASPWLAQSLWRKMEHSPGLLSRLPLDPVPPPPFTPARLSLSHTPALISQCRFSYLRLSSCVAQTSPKLTILLPQLPECWDERPVLSYCASSITFKEHRDLPTPMHTLFSSKLPVSSMGTVPLRLGTVSIAFPIGWSLLLWVM